MTHCGRSLPVAVGLLAIVSVSAAADQESPLLNLGETAANLVYTPLPPCRIIDTRLTATPLSPGIPRSFFVTGTAGFETQGGVVGGCGVPASSTAAMLNFAAVSAAGPGNLRAFPYGQTQPLASVVNYAAISGLALANGVAVSTCNHASSVCPFDLTVQANASATHLVVDVLGFYGSTGSVITGVSAGSGLSGGGSSGNVTLSVDEDVTQLRVGGSCGVGSSIRSIDVDGSVICQPDTNSGGTVTAVAAGDGLLGGTITGSGTVSANFAGSGVASTIARSDHTHPPPSPILRTLTISPLSCTPYGVLATDWPECAGAGFVRTDGDNAFPCTVLASAIRETWTCPLVLPPDSQITSIVAHGFDQSTDGYMEALAWRVSGTDLTPDPFTDFAGVWQSTGIAFDGGLASFPIFSSATPHTVSADFQYVIAFALRAAAGDVWANGFKVTYLGP